LHAQDTKSYKIIVNKKNTTIALSDKEISKIFLKKIKHWDNGKRIVPVDLPLESGTRKNFTADTHLRKISSIIRYWQQELFAGRGRPPKILPSDDEVIKFIMANPYAIGYVSSTAKIADVKVIKIMK
jgi:ABC-type phosphate transport system substrate-binding protein